VSLVTTICQYSITQLIIISSHYYVDAAYYYRWSRVVCLSVGWLVCHNLEPCKNGWTDQDAVSYVDSGGPKEPCIRWESRSSTRRANFKVETLSAQQMAGWKSKINNSSITESELRRNAGPSAFQLQETMLKCDKIWYTYLMINCVSLWTFWTLLVIDNAITKNAKSYAWNANITYSWIWILWT